MKYITRHIHVILHCVLLSHSVFNAQIQKDSILNALDYIKTYESNFNKVYPLAKKIKDISVQLKDTLLIIKSYQTIGDVLWYASVYGEAEEYYFKSLEITDSSKYPREYAYALYGIGWIECIQKGKREKVQLLKRAFNIYKQLKDTGNIIILSNAIAGAYQELYNQDTTQKCYLDSAINSLYSAFYLINKSEKWKTRVPEIYPNLAQELLQKGDYINAYKIINEHFRNPSIYKHKTIFITSILIKSQVLNKLSYKDSARYLINKYSDIILETDDNQVLKDYYELLYEYNKEDKNYAKALQYHEKYLAITEQINKQLLSVKYEELDAQKELYKKEQSLIAIQKENEINQLQNKQKTYFLTIALISIFIIGFFLLKTLKQNSEIKKLNSEISLQKNLLEQKNKDILDSINYASRIQKALITSNEYIQNHFQKENFFQDYFVLYLPKDIVSGDFYWANVNVQHPDKPHYLAVCDCTGHGVPGAFMSLLNINFLNEAIQERQLFYPNDILNYVRQKLIQNLSYDEQQKDGMDASLILFDQSYKQNFKIYYALANHQMIVVRNKQSIVLYGDKMPVGHSYSMKDFNLYEFQLLKNDWVYLFTDGYKDQFGGEKGKRMMHKKFVDIITDNSNQPPDEQLALLNHFFTEWKQNQEQTDDVCIMGFKV
ncbi:MAG: SpoIIE family protein phosphatase [Bacteroidia bacterium]|nr:SpoIIE family protein phosphatase [Bacteroidia bacterium]